jgi:protocatechuate 3,4-dioxygenase alpha subunit
MPATAGFDNSDGGLGHDITGPNAAGARISVEGRVLDGAGTPARDAVIEVWQANAAGIYAHRHDPRASQVEKGFRGWGRVACDFDSGLYCIETVKPGPVPGPENAMMAPHLNLWIVARGINIGLHTRMYFADEEVANAADPVLKLIEPAARRATLLAAPAGEGAWRFDICLQGGDETVFFDI